MTHYDLQFGFDVYQPQPTPQWQLNFGDFIRAVSPFMRVALWVVVAIAVAFVAYLIGREIIRRGLWKRDAKAKEPEEIQWRPAPIRARARYRGPAGAPDALARRRCRASAPLRANHSAKSGHQSSLRKIYHARYVSPVTAVPVRFVPSTYFAIAAHSRLKSQ